MRLVEGCRYQVLAEKWLKEFEAWMLAVWEEYLLFLGMERQQVRRL
jgi:hypothetical protein